MLSCVGTVFDCLDGLVMSVKQICVGFPLCFLWFCIFGIHSDRGLLLLLHPGICGSSYVTVSVGGFFIRRCRSSIIIGWLLRVGVSVNELFVLFLALGIVFH